MEGIVNRRNTHRKRLLENPCHTFAVRHFHNLVQSVNFFPDFGLDGNVPLVNNW